MLNNNVNNFIHTERRRKKTKVTCTLMTLHGFSVMIVRERKKEKENDREREGGHTDKHRLDLTSFYRIYTLFNRTSCSGLEGWGII